MTRASRARGNRTELVVAKFLTDHDVFGGKVITTRQAMAGVRRGDDLCFKDGTPLPVSIEVKGTRQQQPDPAWLVQAATNAQGRPWVVIWRPQDGPVGRSWVIEGTPDDFTLRWLGQWVRQPVWVEVPT